MVVVVEMVAQAAVEEGMSESYSSSPPLDDCKLPLFPESIDLFSLFSLFSLFLCVYLHVYIYIYRISGSLRNHKEEKI